MIENLQVKERILHVSRELFIENGYNGTSIRDIAAASDTNVAMVNYYYRSKYHLFEIVFEEAFEVLTNRIFSILSSDLPFLDLVALWIDSYYETLLEYPHLPIFILNEINQDPDRLTSRIQSKNPYAVFARITDRIDQEVKAGTIVPYPPLDLLLNVVSLCVFPFVFQKMASFVADKTSDEYREMLQDHKKHVTAFVINALKP